MELMKFILWLSTGAVIGWFAGRTVMAEYRRTQLPIHDEDSGSEKS